MFPTGRVVAAPSIAVSVAFTCLTAPPPAHAQIDTLSVRATTATTLYFDVSPDGRAIVFDVFGQLWTVPVAGGAAQLVHSAVDVTADDRQPAYSPDGRWIAARSDRPQGRGVWLHGVVGDAVRQLTDSALILGGDAGVPAWSPDGRRIAYYERGGIVIVDVASRQQERLSIAGLENAVIDEPAWSPDGRQLLISGPWVGGAARALLEGAPGAGIWVVDVAARTASRFTPENVRARAPAYSPDGRAIAYFIADANDAFQLVAQPLDGEPVVVSALPGIEPRRVRWSAGGASLFFVANGKLQRAAVGGGPATEIPFVADLQLSRARYARSAPHLTRPGARDTARGFAGLAIAPDGRSIGMLALGKLWLIDRHGTSRASMDVPPSANGLVWSPDGKRVAWSAGPQAAQDVWVTDLRTGRHRRLSRTGGSDSRAAWKPDGKRIAYLHNDGHVHLVDAAAQHDSSEVIGPQVPFSEIAAFSHALQWTSAGDTLLVYGMNDWPVASRECVRALLLPLQGEPKQVAEFPCRPGHGRLARDGTLITVENGVLTERQRDERGWGVVSRAGNTAALHPSVSDHGTLLYVAGDGLRIRKRGGEEERLGWPIHFRAPLAAPVVIRNVRIVPLDANADTAVQDILLRDGRIAEIAAPGRLRAELPAAVASIDGAGLWAMPALLDAHSHMLSTGLASLRAALYHGVTIIREMWHPLAESASFRDQVAAGAIDGARVIVSGPPFYPALTIPSVTSDFLWIPVDSASTARGLELLRAFRAGHVKMRYAQNWSATLPFLRQAHRFGLPAGGHCAHTLAAVAGGIDTHEHADGQCGDLQFGIHEDIAALYLAAGVTVVPVIDVHDEVARVARDTLRLYAPGVRAFRAGLRVEEGIGAAFQRRLETRAARARANTRVLHEAGVRVAAGADAETFPGGLTREIEALVNAGLSPLAALRAATADAAATLGVDQEFGRVATGMRADILLLDANPLDDVRNLTRIRHVLQDGRVIDRTALLQQDRQN